GLTGEIMSHSVKLRATFWTSGQYEKMARRARLGATNATKVSHSRTDWRDRVVRTRLAVTDTELTSACAQEHDRKGGEWLGESRWPCSWANCQKKFGRLRLVPKSGLSAELLVYAAGERARC